MPSKCLQKIFLNSTSPKLVDTISIAILQIISEIDYDFKTQISQNIGRQ